MTKDQVEKEYKEAVTQHGRLPHLLLKFFCKFCRGDKVPQYGSQVAHIRNLLDISRGNPLGRDQLLADVIHFFKTTVLSKSGDKYFETGLPRCRRRDPPYFLPEGESKPADKIHEVVDYSIRNLLLEGADDAGWIETWNMYYSQYLKDCHQVGNPDPTCVELAKVFERFCNPCITVDTILSSRSFGVFFRMPSWLAHFDHDIIQRSAPLQDALYGLGYRSFDMIERPETCFLCGYNIGEPPQGAEEGADDEEKRSLVDKMSREYREALHEGASVDPCVEESFSQLSLNTSGDQIEKTTSESATPGKADNEAAPTARVPSAYNPYAAATSSTAPSIGAFSLGGGAEVARLLADAAVVRSGGVFKCARACMHAQHVTSCDARSHPALALARGCACL